MTLTTDGEAAKQLSLPEELILMLLNEESGYFHQVPGWDLNCTVAGAALAELSLMSRIDTDMDSLFLLDRTETGDPTLDPILNEIAGESARRNAQYWIERLAPRAESIIDMALDHLVELKILEHHDGEFWTLSRAALRAEVASASSDGNAAHFVRTRISKVIFNNEIPDPRDIIIIALIDTCDVFRFMFQLDEVIDERIQAICKLDLIARSIADAVSQNLAGPLLRRSALTKDIPSISLRKLLLNPHVRTGNIPALFADLAHEYGPVFEIRRPFAEPMVFLAGPETNNWVNKRGRMHLRARDYFTSMEEAFGASGLIPSLDGADHFRLRKAMQPGYSRERLAGQIDQLFHQGRKQMADWKVGGILPATSMSRRMINAQLSPLVVSLNSQDIVDDLIMYKERALAVHVLKVLPKFMLNTPNMRRRGKAIDTVLRRIQDKHTSAQRAGAARDLVDDLLSLHGSDPQFFPESNMRFTLTAPLLASMYLGDALSLAVYAMASQPALYRQIQREADALFDNGDPKAGDFTREAIDVTHRFLMECLRMYPIIPMSLRTVMNSCVVENYELPVGSRLYIATTASHYMSDVFPDPFKFDIDRYLPPRNEHLSPGYAPYGLGTHRCLGSRWVELHLAVTVLMIAHYFTLEVSPANFKFRFNPIPSMKPSKKLKFRIAEQRHEIEV